MNFYDINYLQAQSNLNDYLKYIIIFSTLFVTIVAYSLYMRHRLQTKYRDLSIIAFLFLLFISGVQYSEYTNSENVHSKSSQMVNFVRSLAKAKNVNVSDIYSIVKIKNNFYRVNLSADQNTYFLQETWLTNPAINVVTSKD